MAAQAITVRCDRQLGIALAVSAGLGFALGFLPLLGGPGYETAVVSGLLLPSLAGFTSALSGVRRAGLAGPVGSPAQAGFAASTFTRGMWIGFWVWAAFLSTSGLHGLLRGLCDPWQDLLLMLLGPGFGSVLGGAWGALVGLFISRRWDNGAGRPLAVRFLRSRAATGALLLPLACVSVSVWRFLSSPMVFAYDPFVGFFSGSIYDTLIQADGLYSYRLGSAATLLAAWAILGHVARGEDGGFRLRWAGQPGRVLVGLAGFGVSLGVTLSGPKLGHYFSAADVKRELGGELSYGRCDLVYDATLSPELMQALGRDCDAQLHALEAFFGAPGPERVTAYFFANAAQKQRLMGALNVYIAKPWRREVYLQTSGYPHGVLGHELAHVVAGAYAKGPFKVPGRLYGIFANPGLIEGMAVAASPDEDADLSLQQWAKAMLDLELLPPLERVFHLGFLGENSSKAYTVAGAFIEWLRAEHGADTLRGWYAGQELSALTGKELSVLEQDWRQSLTLVSVPAESMSVAKARFDRPAIFGRRCPHAVDALYARARSLIGSNPKAAEASCAEILRLEPAHLGARLTRAEARAAQGDRAGARAAYEKIREDNALHESQRALASEALGDLELLVGNTEQARAYYNQVLLAVVNEDQKRSLELRRDVEGPREREALVSLLIGSGGAGREWIDAAAKLGRWSEREPEDGLPDYLLGRNLYGNGRFTLAQPLLQSATRKRIENPRARSEASRTLLLVACARGDLPVARRAFADYQAEGGVAAARREGTARFAARCGAAQPPGK